MMIVLVLLGAFVCIGLSHGTEEVYGGSFHIMLPRKIALFEFIPKDSTNVTVLWKEGDRKIGQKANRMIWMTSSYFSLSKVTQKDSGRYIMKDKDGKQLSTRTLEVTANTKTYEQKPGERFSISYRLESDSCNIYFFPESVHQPRVLKHKLVHQGRLLQDLEDLDCKGFDLTRQCGISKEALQMSCKGRYEIRDENNSTALVVSLQMERITETLERKPGESFEFSFDLEPKSCNINFFPENDDQTGHTSIDLVRQGRLQSNSDESCTGFMLLHPCGILNEDVQMECNGRYVIQDQNGDTAMEVSLEMEPLPYEPSHIGIGAGVFLVPLLCYCVRCCCCGKSSSKQERSETAAAEPDVHVQEHDHEPFGPRPDQLRQPSATHYPAPPPYTPSGPMFNMFDHPTVNLPPAYSEVISAPAEPADAPTVPVLSDPGPQFELNGTTFPSAPPLSSDSTYCAVYTSDKLDFL